MRTLSPALAVAAAFLAGCAFFGAREPAPPAARLPAWLGRVVMVDAVHRFVLVDTGAGAALKAGTAAVALREKRRTALLRVTREARPPYVAMEILEGTPESGDQVAVDEGREPPPNPGQP